MIVNVSSGAATLGSPGEYVQYAAAKAGVDALTVGLAQEVAGEGIRVVGVAPGIVRTRIHEDAGDAGRLERVAAERAARPGRRARRVADAIAFLIERPGVVRHRHDAAGRRRPVTAAAGCWQQLPADRRVIGPSCWCWPPPAVTRFGA